MLSQKGGTDLCHMSNPSPPEMMLVYFKEIAMLSKLKELVGSIPTSEDNFKRRMRIHQGWWRAFVLGEEEGVQPIRSDQTVCNTIRGGETTNKNFLTDTIASVVHDTIRNHQGSGHGIIEEGRLFNNLLSSQPLCFNFFAELREDKVFALQALNGLGFHISEVRDVIFEYAPTENYTTDNSAFDVAIEVARGEESGLIGLECKYTDSFSSKEYDKPAYREIFQKSNVFEKEYDTYRASSYNQLFRNQLIAEALLQNSRYDFVITGLFCHRDDKAVETGVEFQSMLDGRDEVFKVITYQDFIEAIQKSDVSWEKRELSMLLWARYCATELSQTVFESY